MSAKQKQSLIGLVSIHDVMPETLPQIRLLVAQLSSYGVDKITLLVVPGKNWSDMDILQLQDWQANGYTLAGHGWNHEAEKPRGVYHRIHSLLLSRLAAEHLSLNRDQIFELINRCYAWFIEKDLTPPTLYVPPAWALGRLNHQDLCDLPFKYYESSAGIYSVEHDKFIAMPLVGYEADRNWRVPILRLWNTFNTQWVSAKRPLRISIHPYDLQYPLRVDLLRHLRRATEALDCGEVFELHGMEKVTEN